MNPTKKTLIRLLTPIMALLMAVGVMSPAAATESTNCGWATTDSGASSYWCVQVRWDRNGVGADVNRIKLYKDGGKALRAEYTLAVYNDYGDAVWARNLIDWTKVDGEWGNHIWYPGVWANTPGRVRLEMNVRMGEGDGEPAWDQIVIPVWFGQDW